jgi:hypothetical protein
MFALLTVNICLFAYISLFEGKFMIEFGNSADTRNEFIKQLSEHNISSHTETDHLGRVWIVPDQTKRKEFDEVCKIWEKKRANEIKNINQQYNRQSQIAPADTGVTTYHQDRNEGIPTSVNNKLF